MWKQWQRFTGLLSHRCFSHVLDNCCISFCRKDEIDTQTSPLKCHSAAQRCRRLIVRSHKCWLSEEVWGRKGFIPWTGLWAVSVGSRLPTSQAGLAQNSPVDLLLGSRQQFSSNVLNEADKSKPADWWFSREGG